MIDKQIDIVDTDENKDEEYKASGVELLMSFFKTVDGTYVPKPNIADLCSDNVRQEIGSNVINGYQADLDSMEDWSGFVENGRKLVKQETTSRSTPWEGASNFKSPVLMQAALKFSDRASTELLRQEDIVKTTVIGKDKNGDKLDQAERVAEYSNYQLNIEMDEWREEHEKLLYQLPYDGCVFKKTFFDFRLGRPVSNVITYPNFVVNNDTDSIARLRRFSETFELSANEVIDRQRQGLWLDTELNLGATSDEDETTDQAIADKFTTFIEQQGYFDLDNDGYEEPYTFVVEKSSQKVVRIIPRFEPSDVLVKNEDSMKATKLSEMMGENGNLYKADVEVVRIKSVQTVTKYGFLRDPQGGFLDVGYSHLLGALTAGINATTNMLFDSGTLSNLGGGFLAKGHRSKMGSSSFKPGQWKQTGISAQDLQTGIVPLPVKEPSPTLFSLMQFMMSSAQELSASADLTQALGANAPATTTLALVQEQQQSAGAIILRIYRAMSSEFKKLFVINSKFLDPVEYAEVLDDEEASFESDFDLRKMNIVPIANPEISSKIQRIQQAQAELSQIEMVQAAGGDIKVVVKRFYEAIGTQNIEELFPEMQPQEQLQKLLSENPDLAEMISGESERMDLLAAAEKERLQDIQDREDLKVATDVDKTNSDMQISQAKLQHERAKLASDQEERDTEFAIKMTEMEQERKQQLDLEVKTNKISLQNDDVIAVPGESA
jgi:chaperonin GroES